jgi:hypothetical protein
MGEALSDSERNDAKDFGVCMISEENQAALDAVIWMANSVCIPGDNIEHVQRQIDRLRDNLPVIRKALSVGAQYPSLRDYCKYIDRNKSAEHLYNCVLGMRQLLPRGFVGEEGVTRAIHEHERLR